MSALLSLLLLAQAAIPAHSQVLPKSGKAEVGREVPWFAGWTLDDQVLNRTRLLAHPTAKAHALVFFATWCKPCERGLTALKARRTELEKKGLNVVLVVVGQQPAEVQPWLKRQALDDLPVVFDRFGTMARTFGAQQTRDGALTTRLPRTAVFTADGTVRRLVAEEGADYVDVLLAPLP